MLEIRQVKGLNTRIDTTDQAPEYARELINYNHVEVPGRLTVRKGYTQYIDNTNGNATKGFEFITSDGQHIYLLADSGKLKLRIDNGPWNSLKTPEGCSIIDEKVDFFVYRDRVYIVSPGSPLMVLVRVEGTNLYNTYSNVDNWVLTKAALVPDFQGVVAPKKVLVNPADSTQLLVATYSSGLEIRSQSDFSLIRRIGTESGVEKLDWFGGHCFGLDVDSQYVYVTALVWNSNQYRPAILKFDPTDWSIVASYIYIAGSNTDISNPFGLVVYNNKVYVGCSAGVRRFSSDLQYEASWAGTWTGVSPPVEINALTISSDGTGLIGTTRTYTVWVGQPEEYITYPSVIFNMPIGLTGNTDTVDLNYESPSVVNVSIDVNTQDYIYIVDSTNRVIRRRDLTLSVSSEETVVSNGELDRKVQNPTGISFDSTLGFIVCDYGKIATFGQFPNPFGDTVEDDFVFLKRLDGGGDVQLLITEQTQHTDDKQITEGQYFYAVSIVYDDNEESPMSESFYVQVNPDNQDGSVTNHLQLRVKNTSELLRARAFHIWRAFAPLLAGGEPTTPFYFLERVEVSDSGWRKVGNFFHYDFLDLKAQSNMASMSFEEMTGIPEFIRGQQVMIDSATVSEGQMYVGGVHYTDNKGRQVDLPQQIRWSPPGVMSQIPLTAENYVNIGDSSSGEIITLTTMFNRVVAFQKHAIVLIYDGIIEKTLPGYSLVDKNSIARYDNAIFFATSDGIYVLEGYNVQRISDAIAENMGITKARAILVNETQEYWVSINDQYTYIYHLPSRSWRKYSYSFENYYINPDRKLIGIKGDKLFTVNEGADDDGLPITATFRTPTILFDLDSIKYIKKVLLEGTGTTTVNLKTPDRTTSIGFTMTSGKPTLRRIRGMFTHSFELEVLQSGSGAYINNISIDLTRTSNYTEKK